MIKTVIVGDMADNLTHDGVPDYTPLSQKHYYNLERRYIINRIKKFEDKYNTHLSNEDFYHIIPCLSIEFKRNYWLQFRDDSSRIARQE